MGHQGEYQGLVTVHLAATEFEAQTVATVLRDREIDAVVFASATAVFGMDSVGNRLLGGIPVQVRADDLDRAKSALRANKFLSDSVDWDQVEVGDEDPQVQALARKDTFMTFGRFMVAAGRYALLLLLLLQVLMGIVRCV